MTTPLLPDSIFKVEREDSTAAKDGLGTKAVSGVLDDLTPPLPRNISFNDRVKLDDFLVEASIGFNDTSSAISSFIYDELLVIFTDWEERIDFLRPMNNELTVAVVELRVD